ncbi:MAG: alanine--tRNA ligase [Candidatus Altiarchaeota archaeon]|nr:alanine--tRNA ligase [Candidatus Altiarchaeota archaeon]
MTYDFRELKEKLKPEFSKEYAKYYPVESLKALGFQRSVCKKCGRGFWSVRKRDYCDEPACSGGYRFIGEKLTRKKFEYKEAWDEYVKTFSKWGYVPIKRYPVVCRWYDELYFVTAGINDFQPYVVAGEVEPPADAVLEPQFCLRFQDMDSVGITGRHYTGFIMVGQHTFNRPDKYVYFKEEGIRQINTFLTEGLGIKPEELYYHEDVWAGGGNFGPSMEFFSRGLELGNQVYMQYKVNPDGSYDELKTKVIDMGAGLERWSWFSQGLSMSYDTVFPKVMRYLRKASGLKQDEKFVKEFSKYAGIMSLDEIDDVRSLWSRIAADLGMSPAELKRKVYEMRSLYAIGDHTRSLLVAIHDGALPSNVGGGYNLRNILRRCWSIIDEFKFDVELDKVFEEHIGEFGSWNTELKDSGSLFDIIETERQRFKESKGKSGSIIGRIVERSEKIDVEKMVELYDSHGITPEVIREFTGVEVPHNFYKLIEERHERSKPEKEKEIEVPAGIQDTRVMYYDESNVLDFKAKVVNVFGNNVVLDKTYFYPEGGGQEADHGVISGKRVLDVKKSGKVVVHIMAEASGINEGEFVECKVDEKRRKQLTLHHTATHIVNAAARDVLGPHIWQAGAHKGEDTARLDITHYKGVNEEELIKIEAKANEIIGKALAVGHCFMKRDVAEKEHGFTLYQGGAVPGTEIRVVSILGIDHEACGGTHVDNTADVGMIKIVSAKRIQDGVVRLEFKAGESAETQEIEDEEIFNKCISKFTIIKIADAEYRKDLLVKSAKIFSVQVSQLPSTVERFASEVKDGLKGIRESGGEFKYANTASDIADASEKLFDAWKAKNKILEGLQESESKKILDAVTRKFDSEYSEVGETRVVKHVTSGIEVKILTEIVKQSVEKGGRMTILVNEMDDKCNIVVASKSQLKAGEICRKLSELLGGGGGGSPTLGIGGGKSEGLEKKLAEFNVQ